MNNCCFTGRFASSPRRQDTPSVSRCFFTLMVNKEGKKADGTKFAPTPVDFVAWGKYADLICQYKEKGHLVLVTAEYGTYERDVVDMNNNPVPNTRKILRPIFSVKHIEFMPTGAGRGADGSSQYTNSLNDVSGFNVNDFEANNSNPATDKYNLGAL